MVFLHYQWVGFVLSMGGLGIVTRVRAVVIMVGFGIMGGWVGGLLAMGPFSSHPTVPSATPSAQDKNNQRVLSKAEREARKLLIKKCLYTEGILDPHFEEQEKKDKTWQRQIMRFVIAGACGWVLAKMLQGCFLGHTPIGNYYRAENTKFLFQKNLHEGARVALECAELFHESVDGMQDVVLEARGASATPFDETLRQAQGERVHAPEMVAGGRHPSIHFAVQNTQDERDSGRVPGVPDIFTGVVVPGRVRSGAFEKSWEMHKKNAAGVKQGLFLLLWAGMGVGAYYLIKYGKEKFSRPYTHLLNDVMDHWFEHRIGVPDFLIQEGDVLRALRDLYGIELDEETAQEIVLWWAGECLEARLE